MSPFRECVPWHTSLPPGIGGQPLSLWYHCFILTPLSPPLSQSTGHFNSFRYVFCIHPLLSVLHCQHPHPDHHLVPQKPLNQPACFCFNILSTQQPNRLLLRTHESHHVAPQLKRIASNSILDLMCSEGPGPSSSFWLYLFPLSLYLCISACSRPTKLTPATFVMP